MLMNSLNNFVLKAKERDEEVMEKENNTSLNTTKKNSKSDETKKYPYTTSIVADGKRKFHTTYENEEEMIEEYDLNTNQLLIRKVRKPTTLGGEGKWEYEIGGEPEELNYTTTNNQMNDFLKPSSTNPIFIRKDTNEYFQFRIRNCFYSKDNYEILINDENNEEIIIKTKNKKYYKRFNISDMKRLKLPLEKNQLSWKLENHTIIISYKKPNKIIQLEREKEHQLIEMKKERLPREGDVQCPQQ
ncbi:hypothetical protein ABK040_005199 [Willaertia magna]